MRTVELIINNGLQHYDDSCQAYLVNTPLSLCTCSNATTAKRRLNCHVYLMRADLIEVTNDDDSDDSAQ